MASENKVLGCWDLNEDHKGLRPAHIIIVKFLTVQNKSNLNLRHICVFSPASAKRGRVRFLALLIENKEAWRALNFGKQGSSALVTANLTLNFKNAPSLQHLKR